MGTGITAYKKRLLYRIIKIGMSDKYDIQCGYEVGCLGYSLYNQLTVTGVKCVILVPTTMLTQ